jgi:hypothetical protein
MAPESLMQQGFFVEAGTYLVVEIEQMNNYVTQIPVIVAPPLTAAKRAPRAPPAKPVVPEVKSTFFFKRCIISGDKAEMNEDELQFLSSLEETIVSINATVLNIREIATVSSVKVEIENSPAVTGFIFMSGTFQLVVLEMLENAPSEKLLSDFLSNTPSGSRLFVVTDFAQRFISPRLYFNFDCAVKKFKLGEPLDQILKNPAVYIQNSPLSNCFRALTQLDRLYSLTRFSEATEYKLWPVASELELVNAKLGCLLSMEELSFLPRSPPSAASGTPDIPAAREQAEHAPALEYCPVSEEHEVPRLCGWRHLDLIHDAQIEQISARRRRPPRACIASDGDSEIWRSPPDPEALARDGWVVERPVPHIPLAEAVGPFRYGKSLRPPDGAEARGGSRFYSFSTPKTVLPSVVELKADRNRESWAFGDAPLATADAQWLGPSRGPVRSTFAAKLHPVDEFGEFHPLTLDEEWRPPIDGARPRGYATDGVGGRPLFRAVIPLARRGDCLARDERDGPPLCIQEEWRCPPLVDMLPLPPTRGNLRFTTIFPDNPPKAGDTDSRTARKVRPTFGKS